MKQDPETGRIISYIPDWKQENAIVACGCGCGESFAKYNERGQAREFVSGHNAKLREKTVKDGTCEQCGKRFPLKWTQIQKVKIGKPVYCTRSCSNKASCLTQEQAASAFLVFGLEMTGAYVNSHVPVSVKCIKCGYEWCKELNNKAGCPVCAGNLPKREEDVFKRFYERRIHMLEPYISYHALILLRCMWCGHEWRSSYANAGSKSHCPQCSGVLQITKEQASVRFYERRVHMIGDYLNTAEPVLVRCMQCGHEWKKSLEELEHGCPECRGPSRFDPLKPAILYYAKIATPYGSYLYKIGITNLSVEERFSGDLHKIEILKIERFSIGSLAYDKERSILQRYRMYRYCGEPVLRTGNTELFKVDILGLENAGAYQSAQLELSF